MESSSVDAFLGALPEDQRRALSELRMRLRQLVPEASETISHGVHALELDGRALVGGSTRSAGAGTGPVSGW